MSCVSTVSTSPGELQAMRPCISWTPTMLLVCIQVSLSGTRCKTVQCLLLQLTSAPHRVARITSQDVALSST